MDGSILVSMVGLMGAVRTMLVGMALVTILTLLTDMPMVSMKVLLRNSMSDSAKLSTLSDSASAHDKTIFVGFQLDDLITLLPVSSKSVALSIFTNSHASLS